MDCYSARKKNEIMTFTAIWMDLEIIILSKVRERQISYDITYMWNLKNNKTEFFFFFLQNRNRPTNIENV